MRIASTASFTPIQRTVRIMPLGHKIRNSESSNKKTEGRFDSSAINPFSSKKHGGAADLVNAIMEKRTGIIENKHALVTATLESGGELKSIQVQLDVYDEILTSLDEQIAEITAAEAERLSAEITGDKKREKPNSLPSPPITNHTGNDGMGGLSGQIADISFLSGDIQSLERLASTKERFDSNIEVLKSEIKMDASYGGSSLGSKQELLAELQNVSNAMSHNLSAGYGDIQSKAENIAGTTEIAVEQQASEKSEEESVAEKPTRAQTEKYLAAVRAASEEEKPEILNRAV